MDQVRYYKDANGEYRWRRLDMQNHKKVGGSTEGYASKEHMIENAQRVNGPKSESLDYIDLTLDDD